MRRLLASLALLGLVAGVVPAVVADSASAHVAGNGVTHRVDCEPYSYRGQEVGVTVWNDCVQEHDTVLGGATLRFQTGDRPMNLNTGMYQHFFGLVVVATSGNMTGQNLCVRVVDRVTGVERRIGASLWTGANTVGARSGVGQLAHRYDNGTFESGRNERALWYWFDPDPMCTSEGAPPPALPVAPGVPGPALTCTRRIKDDAFVTAYAVVSNPSPSATDVYSWKFPWESEWRQGQAIAGSKLPDLATMPNGGWRAQCRVVRTVLAGGKGSPGWAELPTTLDVQDCRSTDTACLEQHGGWQGAALAGAGVITATKIASPANMATWNIINATSRQTALAAIPKAPVVAPPPSWPVVGTSVAVATAGVAGYLAGGLLAAAGLDDALQMDKGWLCNNNPSYRATNATACADLALDTLQLRGHTQFSNPDGSTTQRSAPGAWVTAEAVAEVLIDPTRPEVGVTNTVVSEPNPTPTPEQVAKIEQAAGDPSPTPNPGTETSEDSARCPTGLGILNPFNMGKLLMCLFVPSPASLSALHGVCVDEFPCSWVHEAVTSLGVVRADMAAGMLDGCAPRIGFDWQGHQVGARMPSPADSGCAGNGEGGARLTQDDQAGDLFGYRVLARNVGLVLLWFVFIRTMVSKMPWAKGDDLPVPA
jgi:hypothetical protein